MPRSRGGGSGGGWGGWLTGIIVVLFLIYIAMSLISTFSGTMANLAWGGGVGIGSTIFGLVQTWIIPFALIGLLIYGITHFLKGGGRH
jgi:hypothetical protein